MIYPPPEGGGKVIFDLGVLQALGPDWTQTREKNMNARFPIMDDEAAGTARAEDFSMTEQEAIRRAQNGEAQAFEFLYRMHGGKVYALCLAIAIDPGKAETFTHEVFLQVFRKISTFHAGRSFSAWVERVAILTIAKSHSAEVRAFLDRHACPTC